ncbi:SRPBCC family protein [Paenibacillus sp. GCM10023248]|uniref:SRPBCC family protein n=1 Tax=Bacillales TaxID=1385 RepID=UPI002379007D|nr:MULTISPECIES: SRPBCC family protein [Bacillales]MDD9270797.1 SRPBCC family protein [Paenibacillus sp. MAHUQ-63]MDR6883292.1 uncharacterized protein YndB with AHSA1/START domain [Bacillus sp. 3255]
MEAIAGVNEIISTREFDFPREQVFQAWVNPEQLVQWWGPQGFTNTFHECDMRPGGTWRFVMHGPDGKDYPNHSEFVEIVPNERIVIQHMSAPEFQVTATFEDVDGRTKVVFRQLFKIAKQFENAKKYCIEGNEQNFDRLNAVLASGK